MGVFHKSYIVQMVPNRANSHSVLAIFEWYFVLHMNTVEFSDYYSLCDRPCIFENNIFKKIVAKFR